MLNEIEKGIQGYFNSYYYKIDKGFLREAYNYLKNKDKLLGVEYRFLCWLNVNYQYPVEIELPIITLPHTIDLVAFEAEYTYNDKRKKLYKLLSKFINELKNRHNLSVLNVLIGGSYADTRIEIPKDIDICILVPESHRDTHELHLNYQLACNNVPVGVDLRFLPEDYSIEIFKAYSRIVCLGNKAKFKDKDGPFSFNEFTKRKILKISL